MLIAILLSINIVVCIALVAAVLLQRSEGGALGMGGGPTGFMTARGASNLMTQITWGLAIAFFVLSLSLTLLSGRAKETSSVVDRVNVESIDPSKLNQNGAPPPAAPTEPAAPIGPAAPSLDNPFGAPPPANR